MAAVNITSTDNDRHVLQVNTDETEITAKKKMTSGDIERYLNNLVSEIRREKTISPSKVSQLVERLYVSPKKSPCNLKKNNNNNNNNNNLINKPVKKITLDEFKMKSNIFKETESSILLKRRNSLSKSDENITKLTINNVNNNTADSIKMDTKISSSADKINTIIPPLKHNNSKNIQLSPTTATNSEKHSISIQKPSPDNKYDIKKTADCSNTLTTQLSKEYDQNKSSNESVSATTTAESVCSNLSDENTYQTLSAKERFLMNREKFNTPSDSPPKPPIPTIGTPTFLKDLKSKSNESKDPYVLNEEVVKTTIKSDPEEVFKSSFYNNKQSLFFGNSHSSDNTEASSLPPTPPPLPFLSQSHSISQDRDDAIPCTPKLVINLDPNKQVTTPPPSVDNIEKFNIDTIPLIITASATSDDDNINNNISIDNLDETNGDITKLSAKARLLLRLNNKKSPN